ncbi:MAG: hypothetical protein RLY87_2542 [Chloroflexota bacterium]
MLYPKTDFIGLTGTVHLAAGGETPMLASHRDAIEQFMHDKALGMPGRERFFATRHDCAQRVAAMLKVDAADIAFVGSSSAGITSIVSAFEWHAGDEVICVDDEYPSGRYVFGWLQRYGVIPVVPAYHPDPDREAAAIIAAITPQTRLIYISHVSTRTGRRIPLAGIIAAAHAQGARVLVDATHSLGIIDVDAREIDFVVCSGYKWLLGTHLGIVMWNRNIMPDFAPIVGWRSASPAPIPTAYHYHADAARIEVGNPNFIDVYILNNALRYHQHVDSATLESYVLEQGARLYDAIATTGVDMLTPRAARHRAGNICFASTHPAAVVASARQRGIELWGDADLQRVRCSIHGYVTPDDIETAIAQIPGLIQPNR